MIILRNLSTPFLPSVPSPGLWFCLFLTFLASLVPVLAQEPNHRFEGLDSVRFGIMAHNPDHKESGTDLNGQILFKSPIRRSFSMPLLEVLLHPLPDFGGSVSVSGGGTSYIYGGASWRFPLPGVFFLEGSFGLTLHDGISIHNDTSPPEKKDRSQMGCSWSFRESATLGTRFHNWEVLATLEHLSNAGLCEANSGLTNGGLRIGYVF